MSRLTTKAIVYFFAQNTLVRKMHKVLAATPKHKQRELFWEFVASKAIHPKCLLAITENEFLTQEQLVPLRELQNEFFAERRGAVDEKIIEMFPRILNPSGCSMSNKEQELRKHILCGGVYYESTRFRYREFVHPTFRSVADSIGERFHQYDDALSFAQTRARDEFAKIWRISNNRVVINNFEEKHELVVDLPPIDPPDEIPMTIWLVDFPLRKNGEGKWNINSMMAYAKRPLENQGIKLETSPMLGECVVWLNNNRDDKLDYHQVIREHPEWK